MNFDKIPNHQNGAEIAQEGMPEHLKEGVRPIFVCVGTEIDFKDKASKEAHPFDAYVPEKGENVDYVDFFMLNSEADKRNIRNSGPLSYVISEVSDKDKYSDNFWHCTCLAAGGVDKVTGKGISILTHQNPLKFLGGEKEEFAEHLQQRLQELRSRCIEGTIDAVITGGNSSEEHGHRLRQRYINSVNFLSGQIKEGLGFSPHIVAGPKTTEGVDSVFYDSANRRMYLIRPEAMKAKSSNRSFRPEDIEKEKERWESNRA